MKINLIAAVNGAPIGLSFGSERDIIIGREIGSTISPMAAEGLSRHHAKIYFKDGTWYVEDLGSTNGTYRGTDKIEGPTALAVKDKLQFGRFEMSVDEFVDEEKSSTVQLPEAAVD
ncbi:MAG: FHA domain-containing protein, partial [Kiritimatiellae bacterium]|nr:FHA domain-containing protein [Kiritimatiellia bacterium]